MRATCTSCGSPFLFADERFGDRATVKVRCPSCKTVVTLSRPQAISAQTVRVDPLPVEDAAAPSASETGKEPAAAGAAHGDGPPTLRVKRTSSLVEEGKDEHVPPMPAGLRISVALLSGPDTGKVMPCTTSRAVIGRTGSEIPVQDEEISRRHAVVEIRDDRFFLRDLGSTNGTFVDERRITETEIFDRSEFRVGTTHCMLIVTPTDAL